MNKRLITLGIIIVCLCFVLKLIYSGLKNVKLDDFKPAAVVFVVDTSASNQSKLPVQKKFLKQICSRLDPEDQIKIIKVSEEAYLIYEGTAQSSSAINKSMESFTKYEPEALGTAYGDGLKKAFTYALTMKNDGYTPAVVVIGDLENEGDTSKQINWDTLPSNISKFKQYAPDIVVMFLFAHPQKLDMVKEKLNPILGEQKLILAPEENAEKSLGKFLKALGR